MIRAIMTCIPGSVLIQLGDDIVSLSYDEKKDFGLCYDSGYGYQTKNHILKEGQTLYIPPKTPHKPNLINDILTATVMVEKVKV